MKKVIASIIALIAINASAYTVTNTVTIVSNIYNRISEERVITNKVKNTHTNYYYTNNVYTVSNVTLLVSQQTFKTNTTVNLDVSQEAISQARSQAGLAASYAANALDHANDAADSATAAQGHAADAKDYRDEAEYYMEQAHGQVQPIIDEGQRQLAAVQSAGNTQVSRVTSEGTYQYNRVNSAGSSNVGSVNSAGTTVINNINAKQQWFEEHFGQMVTNIDSVGMTASVNPEWYFKFYTYADGMGGGSSSFRVDYNGVSVMPETGKPAISFSAGGNRGGTYDNLTWGYTVLDALYSEGYWHIMISIYNKSTGVEIERKTVYGHESTFNMSSYSMGSFPSYTRDISFGTYDGYNLMISRSTYNGSANTSHTAVFSTVDDVAKYYDILSGFSGSLSAVARSGSYNDLLNKPNFATVATSGNYNDLINKPDSTKAEKLIHKVYNPRRRFWISFVEKTTDFYGNVVYVQRDTVGWLLSYDYTGTTTKTYKNDSFQPTYIDRFTAITIYKSGGRLYVRYTVRNNGGTGTVSFPQALDQNNDVSLPPLDADTGLFTYTSPYNGETSTGLFRITVMDDISTYSEDYYLSGDLNIYDANGTKIGRVIRDTDWNNLSNWVERVFQKK